MRYSKLFGKTRHNAPHDTNSRNAQLLTQAGFVEKQSAGIYNFLPLGLRVLQKVNNIIREEMDAIDGQEILMPALHSRQVWKATGRDAIMEDVLYRTTGTDSQEFVLGPSHEEVVTPLVKKYIQSYKDLPVSVYQIQTKFRNEPRAKSGLLRGREFGMKDLYSFHLTEEDLDEYYENAKEAYLNVFDRCGLKAHVIEASGGAFTDKFSHEFSVETPAGEDTIIVCEKCGKAQNLEVAEGKIVDPDQPEEKEEPLKGIDMERGFTIADNAKAHDVPEWKILKTVVYELEEGGLVGVCIRGDLSVNGHKLEKYFGKALRPASPETLKKAGLVQGYISPVGNPEGLRFVADHSIKNVKNFVTGGNAPAKDYINVNVGRDFQIDDFSDFVEVKGAFKCSTCDVALKEMIAVEAGNIFKLGTKFSEDAEFKVSGPDGKLQPVVMGCYGIGNTRLVGTIAEASHDDNGIVWPKSVAPYHVHMASLGSDQDVLDAAEKLYQELLDEDVEVLYDDRDCSPGVKFKDADLVGIPLRLVVSKRSMEAGGAEWKERPEGSDAKTVKLENVVKDVLKFVNS
jgi:prolyl-tRNA synthetase